MGEGPERTTGRRAFLTTGVTVAGLVATGCLGRGEDIQDTDGDGVIDSEDYAPRDSSVQRAEQVQEAGSTPTGTEPPTETPTATPTSAGETMIDDFEDGDVGEWGGASASLQASTDAIHGQYSGRVLFDGGSTVWTEFGPSTASEYVCWWKSGAVGDNETKITVLGAPGDDEPSVWDHGGFGIEIGAENQQRVVVNPPFPNGEAYELLTNQPQPDRWYKTRFFNVDFTTHTFDVALYTRSGTKLGEVTGHRFGHEISSATHFFVDNSMNFSGESVYIDHIYSKA